MNADYRDYVIGYLLGTISNVRPYMSDSEIKEMDQVVQPYLDQAYPKKEEKDETSRD